MIIGVPKEIKTNENRVALVPGGAEALVNAGHTVLIEKSAGMGSGFDDSMYINFGAQIVDTAAEVWKRADMIMKVKEPIAVEWPHMRKDQVIFTYFHFAADEALTRAEKFLDDSTVTDIRELRIVHGHGTGQLRRAIGEFLKTHPMVERYETAPQNQGGGGATIVTLRE